MNKRKIIIDCDPGIDDSLAIMLALTSPEIEVLGITIVCGNSPVEMGFENAKKDPEADEPAGCAGLYGGTQTFEAGLRKRSGYSWR